MNQHIKRFITAWGIASIFWIIFFYCPTYIFSLTLFGILLTIIATEWNKFFSIRSPLFWIVTPLYPILPFGLIIYMNQSELYRPLIYYLFLLVFTFDAGSYMVGSLIGRHKIIPSITPKKTYEGFIGGYISTLILFVWTLYEKEIYLSAKFILLFISAVCLIAFCGDLLESFLKRKAQLKDSGCILPGHGGFLDRFDAVMFSSFFMYVLKDWLITFLR